ncbi:MAG TPA: ATP-dependent RNA helicase HrpA, partial [Thermodesulfobacteriaceae bacterium]|nr:ATP-dependent RNA helicase HrpA [Thermodesulfobacteriaceae bacterium]
LQSDQYLRQYDTVIVDEAHERSLNIDFTLGVLRRLVKIRRDFRVIITSATIDTGLFSNAFGSAPVIEISGRSHPVQIRYQPYEEHEFSDITMVKKVILAVDDIRQKDPVGDILVFLPTEREILETVKILKARYEDGACVLPMFGRMPASDQQRIFKSVSAQKIVVATNIAETSITVPGIRYVVDSGLVRTSRYNIRSRTKAMPIAPVSRSSADQRAGRAGRVQAGICIRLYSEEDYGSRPEFTLPEIQRSNLAEVILRLSSMRLGKTENFPFIDPPSGQALKDGFATLRELGAIDTRGRLTERGKVMAKLPLDPRMSRIIIQGRKEGVLGEIAVIAAALSIQDPRERPSGKEKLADWCHAEFRDESSDFLTFLKLWNLFNSLVAEGKCRKKMRSFCRKNFISYNRMLEWRDIHSQILAVLELGGFIRCSGNYRKTALLFTRQIPEKKEKQKIDAIHRSVLSGFLSNIALKKQNGGYISARSREAFIFPGSSLYRKSPRWIVAMELVRTSRLYARTVAPIKPDWIEDLAGDLCRREYTEPHWEKRRGEVVAWEKVTLYGLPVIEKRKISFRRIDPEASREIFIRQALVPGSMTHLPPFLRHNIDLITKVRDLEHRTRTRGIIIDEETLYSFYDTGLRRLESFLHGRASRTGSKGALPVSRFICDQRSLERAVKLAGNDGFLKISRDELLRHTPAAEELELFPGHINVSGQEFPLTYHFSPGSESDGITVRIPIENLFSVPQEPFDWLVPGLIREKIEFLLKSLPKSFRKLLVPIPHTAEKIIGLMPSTGTELLKVLESILVEHYGIRITSSMWPDRQAVPPHLVMRFEITDCRGRTIHTGRDLEAIKKKIGSRRVNQQPSGREWTAIKAIYEKEDIKIENCPSTELPESILVPHKGRHYPPAYAYPALVQEGDGINLRLLLSRQEAQKHTEATVRRMLEKYLHGELRYIRKNCIPNGLSVDAFHYFGSRQKLGRSIYDFLCSQLLRTWHRVPVRSELLNYAESTKKTLVRQAADLLEQTGDTINAGMAARKEIIRLGNSSAIGNAKRPSTRDKLMYELSRLMPPDFPSGIDAAAMAHLPRYLNALTIRARRAHADPGKDLAKAGKIRVFESNLNEVMRDRPKGDMPDRINEALSHFEFMLDEYRVSVFAPELGTRIPVSHKRLARAWKEIASLLGT